MFSMHNPEIAKLSRSVFSYRTLDGCLWSLFVRKIVSSSLLKSIWINMQNIYIKTDAKLFSCINILITCHRLTMNVLHDHCEKWNLSFLYWIRENYFLLQYYRTPILGQCSYSLTPENITKPKLFWCCKGVTKGNISLK